MRSTRTLGESVVDACRGARVSGISESLVALRRRVALAHDGMNAFDSKALALDLELHPGTTS